MKVSHAIVLLLAMVACIYLLSLTPPANQAAPVAVASEGELKIQLDISHSGSEFALPGSSFTKNVTVNSVEQQPAWVWITCAVPSALCGENAPITLHITQQEGWSLFDTALCSIEGVEHTLYTLLQAEPLPGGSSTPPCSIAVTVAPNVAIDTAGSWYLQAEEGNVPLDYNSAQPMLLFDAYAIQQLDIQTAQQAYSIYNHS